MKKIIIGLLLMIALVVPASFAHAQSSNSADFCYNFNRDLYAHIISWYTTAINLSTGQTKANYQTGLAAVKKDIDKLHDVLADQGITVVSERALNNRTFGTSTAEAVATLQTQLKPTNTGLKVSGVFDLATRSVINKMYGCFEKIVVTLTQPNAKVTTAAGQTMNIKYNVAKVPVGTTADLKISYVPVTDGTEGTPVAIETVSNVTNGTNKSYAWAIPANITPGNYKIQLQVVGRNDSTLNSDKSSQAFTILSTQVTLTVPAAPETNWKKGEIGKFTLSKSNGVGALSITAVPWNTETNAPGTGAQVNLLPSVTATGPITVPAAKTQQLAVGSYKLEARTTGIGNIIAGTSNVFSVVSPGITVNQVATWTAGNAQSVTITKTSSVANVKVEAIKITDGQRGTPTVLVTSSAATTIQIPGAATAKLSSGTYVLKVSKVNDATIYGESNQFEVNGPTITLTAPTSKWITGVDGKFQLTKSNAIGGLKISAVKQGETESAPVTLIETLSTQGPVTVPAAKTKLLSAGNYKLIATTKAAPIVTATSEIFIVADPIIEVVTPTMWAKGNPEVITFEKEPGVGAVKITAIPQSGTAGNSIVLVASTNKISVPIPKAKTTLLTVGSYKVEVSSVDRPTLKASTETFQVRAPLIAISKVTDPWKIGSIAKVNLTKDNLVTGSVSISAVKLDENDVPVNAGTTLLPNVTTKGEIQIPINRVNLLSPGKYKVVARTNAAGAVYLAETDPFTVVAVTAQAPVSEVNATAAVYNAMGSIFGKVIKLVGF